MSIHIFQHNIDPKKDFIFRKKSWHLSPYNIFGVYESNVFFNDFFSMSQPITHIFEDIWIFKTVDLASIIALLEGYTDML